MPSKAESLCKRTRSKETGVVGEKTLTIMPVEEVRVMPTIGVLKLRNVAPAGGVSSTVSVRFALPAVHPVVHAVVPRPLHEPREKIAATKRNERRIRFIEHPTEVGPGEDAAYAPCSQQLHWFLLQENSNP